jgi:isoamylase
MDFGHPVSEGSAYPLGPSARSDGFNFSVFASGTDQIELLLFPNGINSEPSRTRMFHSGNLWHIFVDHLKAPFAYAFENIKYRGHFLLDPYCKSVTGGEIQAADQKKKMVRRLYSYVYEAHYNWENDTPPRIPLPETIIYEMHVRGFTRHSSSNIEKPGTYAGVVEKIPYLKDLGITTVELLPVAEFNESDKDLINPENKQPLYNFWGYDPLCFFTPKASYAYSKVPGTHIDEFKYMVKEFHKAGFEVVLDVVFNHTGEGNHNGPIYAYKGLADKIYYLKETGSKRYLDFTGCGHTMNCNHPVVSDLIIDCLRYWVTEMHVDGFRFDLASVLTRSRDGSPLQNPPLIERISLDPVLSQVKLIAEAWDAGGLYQVGSFPAWGIWAEWNGKFRDDLRRFVRGDKGMVPVLATRLAGSADLYRHDNRRPFHSINFITCHDGFTLYDLVSYNTKHNIANGEKNSDGSDNNFSWNHGHEGYTTHKRIRRLRVLHMKNLISLLFVAQGVPMILAGDEMGRTQNGNNNAYCQDNEISWLNWELLKENADLHRFFRRMIAFRKKHTLLQRTHFFGDEPNGRTSIQWYGPKLNPPDWSGNIRHLAFHLLPQKKKDKDIFVITNTEKRQILYKLPFPRTPLSKWHRFVDTRLSPPDDICEEGYEEFLEAQDCYSIRPRSTVILIAQKPRNTK